MAKPVGADMRWATGGTAALSEPSSGLRDTGFVAGTQVDEGYVNKLLKNSYLWQQYLNGLEGEALTWTAAHIFNGAVTINTTPTLSHGFTSSNVAINSASPGTEGGHITGGANTGSGNGGAGVAVTGGASTGGNGGAAVVAIGGASASGFGSIGVQGTAVRAGSGGYFAGGTANGNGVTAFAGATGGYAASLVSGGGFTRALRLADATSNGLPIMELAGYLNMQDSYVPPYNTGFNSILTVKSFAKAWVAFTTNGTASPTINSGLNIASVTLASGLYGSSANYATYLLAAKQAVSGSMTIDGLGNLYILAPDNGNPDRTDFTIFKIDAGGGAMSVVDPSTLTALTFSLTVHGEQ
jgi:hypothetical protein